MEAKKDKLSSAFNLLKTWHCTDGRYVITVDTWHDLMIHVDPKRDKTQRELMMYVLDQNANTYIGELIHRSNLNEITARRARGREKRNIQSLLVCIAPTFIDVTHNTCTLHIYWSFCFCIFSFVIIRA